MARGRRDTPAFGIAFGVSLSRVAGPFQQLQNSSDDEDSLTKLVLQLIRRIPNAAPREEAVRLQVAAFRRRLPHVTPDVESTEASPDTTAIAQMFEEVKIMFRQLPDTIAARLRPATQQPIPSSGRRAQSRPRARKNVAQLRFVPPNRRADAWVRYLDLFEDALTLPEGAFEIEMALRVGDYDAFRKAATAFMNSNELQRENEPTSNDEIEMRIYLQEGAGVLQLWGEDFHREERKRSHT